MAIDRRREVAQSDATSGMSGKGVYDRHSEPQSQAIERQEARLADEFFRRLQDLFTAEPGRHGFEHQVMTLVLRKR